MEIWVIIVIIMKIVKFILLVIFMLSGMIVQTENYNTLTNSFINVIGQLGILAGILFTLFWLVAFIKSFEFYIKNLNKDLNVFLIFSSITLFITMSMMEVLTNTAAIY